MKNKIAVEARVSADGKRCLETCRMLWQYPYETSVCTLFCDSDGEGQVELATDHLGRPLRCRACLRGEVKS